MDRASTASSSSFNCRGQSGHQWQSFRQFVSTRSLLAVDRVSAARLFHLSHCKWSLCLALLVGRDPLPVHFRRLSGRETPEGFAANPGVEAVREARQDRAQVLMHLAGAAEGVQEALAAVAVRAAHALQRRRLRHRLPCARHGTCARGTGVKLETRGHSRNVGFAFEMISRLLNATHPQAEHMHRNDEHRNERGSQQSHGGHKEAPEVSRHTMMGPCSAAGRTSKRPVSLEGSSSSHPADFGSTSVGFVGCATQALSQQRRAAAGHTPRNGQDRRILQKEAAAAQYSVRRHTRALVAHEIAFGATDQMQPVGSPGRLCALPVGVLRR